MQALLEAVNGFIWNGVGLWALLGTGLWLSCRNGWFQLRQLPLWMGHVGGGLFRRSSTRDGSITPFQTLCTALAATVGVGNVVGVAAAITAGGPGAVFWMWVAALLGMMTGYAEKVLGIYYRRRRQGKWVGGPMYYLRDGLGSKHGCRSLGRVLAWLFAAFTLVASFGIGNLVQVRQIALHWEQVLPCPLLSDVSICEGIPLYRLLIGLGVAIPATVAVLGGLTRVATLSERLVPAAVGLFIAGALTVVAVHYRRIDDALLAILQGAFCPRSLWGGGVGIALRHTVTVGFRRGIFSNEAGLGSSVLVHVNAQVTEPVHQGLWGIFEVFADTLVVCTVTALVVLTGGGIDLATGRLAAGVSPDGSDLVAYGFTAVFGPSGGLFVAAAILLFAFTTLLGWSQYGAAAAEYLGGPRLARLHRILFAAVIPLGAVLSPGAVWTLSDIGNGLMMIPNLIGVLALGDQVTAITQNYLQRRIHPDLSPMLSHHPRLNRRT